MTTQNYNILNVHYTDTQDITTMEFKLPWSYKQTFKPQVLSKGPEVVKRISKTIHDIVRITNDN